MPKRGEEVKKRILTEEDLADINSKIAGVAAESQSGKGKDMSLSRVTGQSTSDVWDDLSSTRDLKDWIGDLCERTVELKEKLDKKPDVVEMTLTDYNNLTTKKPNTIYAID